MQNKHYHSLIVLFFFCFGGSIQQIIAQEDHTIHIEKRADVIDGAVASEFHKLPELKSSCNELSVHLYVNEEVYDFVGSKVKMRTYTYESGDQKSEKIGPWGPVLRIGQDDRLNITVHNNLANEKDKSYLGSMDTLNKHLLRSFIVSDSLKEAMVKATTRYIEKGPKDSITIDTILLIKEGNLDGAIITEVEQGKKWIIAGKELCKCPPNQIGTCEKKDVSYPVEWRYNYGSKKNALRIYQLGQHGEDHDHNIPHGFNNTNMHTHGFHVSPFQDDIFRKVPPGDASQYTYKLDNHTPGTMWYHPHVHGSTAIQVASGMSGVIIIEDPDLSSFPDLAAASEPAQERIMVFNQIMYDEEIGELPDFNTLGRIFGGASQGPKGTTINGVTVPKMRMEKGEVQRWRMVHSGYHSNVALHFPEEIEVLQIAVDGIMFDEARKMRTIHLSPGNRTDLLVKVPKSATKSVYDINTIRYKAECEYFPEDTACINPVQRPSDPPVEAMMKIIVEGDREEMGLPGLLPGPVNHPYIQDKEVVNLGNPRKTTFDVPNAGTDSIKFVINGEAFKGDTIHETLTLGTAEDWLLQADMGTHPYHIHINPFQVKTFGERTLSTPMWKDVVMVANKKPVHIRARYTRYWGDFVLHCHLLHHEDQGMMQRIRIKRKE